MKQLRTNDYTITYPAKEDLASNEANSLLSSVEKRPILILSPHMDDVVLSMGSYLSYLASTQAQITILTLFTKGSTLSSPLTEKLLRQGEQSTAEAYFNQREEEDKKALRVLGERIESQNIGFTDAAWRSGENGKATYPDTTLGMIHDNPVPEILKATEPLVSHIENPLVFAPLARGKHADHILTRTLALEIFPVNQIFFYSDFPYSDTFANEDEFITTQKLQKTTWNGDFYEKKARAISHYSSQFASFFGDRGTLTLPLETFYRAKHD